MSYNINNGKRYCDRCQCLIHGSSKHLFRGYNDLCYKCVDEIKAQEQVEKERNELKREKKKEEKLKNEGSTESSSGNINWIKIPFLIAYWAVFILFIYPAKKIKEGIKEHNAKSAIIGFSIYGVLMGIVIAGLIINVLTPKKLEFKGLSETTTIVYGEKYNYMDGIELSRGNESVDGEITYTGTVDSFTLGDYVITYTGEFENETITKDVKISVVPFYTNETYRIVVLEKFTVLKNNSSSYTVSGKITNNSGRDFSAISIEYYCIDNDTNYNINFSNGMPKGDQSFSVVLNSTDPLDTYNFKINKIICSY